LDVLTDMSNKANCSSRLLQEVTNLAMYACIILYILLLQDIVTPCSPLYSTAGIYHTFIHEYDVVYVFHVLETIFLLSRCDIIFIIHI